MSFSLSQPRIDPVSSLCSLPVAVDVLRLDLLHPVISGNKWFKLKECINAAKAESKTTLLTYGGVYSNHLVATAAAASINGLKSIGIVRGEEPKNLSHTLLAAKSYGMSLHFVSREDYRAKVLPRSLYESCDISKSYIINEGGYGLPGKGGAMTILQQHDVSAYTHILTAVGTGTTLAGLVAAALPHQHVIGIPVLKGAFSLQQEIKALLLPEKQDGFTLFWDYHFGGYAKYNAALLLFMNRFYEQAQIPTDFVYTGKAFYAALDLIARAYFPSGAKILLVHTGGLQGNVSLKKGELVF